MKPLKCTSADFKRTIPPFPSQLPLRSTWRCLDAIDARPCRENAASLSYERGTMRGEGICQKNNKRGEVHPGHNGTAVGNMNSSMQVK